MSYFTVSIPGKMFMSEKKQIYSTICSSERLERICKFIVEVTIRGNPDIVWDRKKLPIEIFSSYQLSSVLSNIVEFQ